MAECRWLGHIKMTRNLRNLARYFTVRRRGRLMRDYFLISALLVIGGLVTSGAVEIYFSYIESREQLALVQKEIAAGAAVKIERFVQEIHNIMRGATKSPTIAPERLTSEFRLELEKLLLIAPAVTEAIVFNEQGAIQVHASRLRTVFPDTDDFASAPAFKQAKQGKPYFGSVYFEHGSEPYMTIAVPIERFPGDVIGVLKAEVNLKDIGDVISRITVGKAGYAFAMSRSGELIAHPDISLVLQRRMVHELEIFKAAFPPAGTQLTEFVMIGPNLQGKEVLSAFAQIPGLDWAIVVDRPIQEVSETIHASLFRTATLLLVGLVLALIASIYVARRVLRPIGILQDGVAHFTDNLSRRIELKTGDELEGLADEFNKLAERLQESYTNLEQKIEDRTQELGEKNKQLEAVAESKVRFFNYVAHDMRTPLISIKGFTDLVLRHSDGKLEQRQKDNLRKVLVSSKHLENLVDDLLDLAKGKRKVVNIEAFKLEEVLRFATETVEPMLKDNVKLVTEMASDIPTMKSDCAMLKKIVLNLLSNAAKYTEAGEITVAAACDNGTLKLIVSDTGIGMKAEALQYIFDEFRQVDMSMTQRYPSTGLGLAIVKLFTNLLGGEITVESEEGKGSTFTIVMPMELQPLTVVTSSRA
jgi:signal transduction histidine kinase